jgi:hypothetical protein
MPKSSPRDQIWILAALRLPYRERVEAMQDIADMIGTTYSLVQSQASRLRQRQRADAVALYHTSKPKPPPAATIAPSMLRQLTPAELMSGRSLRKPVDKTSLDQISG